MLTNSLTKDEMTASLGKTENMLIVHVSGEKQICQSVTQKEIVEDRSRCLPRWSI